MLQACTRRFLSNKRLRLQWRDELDRILGRNTSDEDDLETSRADITAVGLLVVLEKLLWLFGGRTREDPVDLDRLVAWCQLMGAVDCGDRSPRQNYVSLALQPAHVMRWLRQLKSLLGVVCGALGQAKGSKLEIHSTGVLLHTILWLMDSQGWKLAEGNTPEMKIRRRALDQLTSNVLKHLLANNYQKNLGVGNKTYSPHGSSTIPSLLMSLSFSIVFLFVFFYANCLACPDRHAWPGQA